MSSSSPYELLRKAGAEKAIDRQQRADRWAALQSQTPLAATAEEPTEMSLSAVSAAPTAPSEENRWMEGMMNLSSQTSQQPTAAQAPLRHGIYDAILQRHAKATQAAPKLTPWQDTQNKPDL